ncbi:MAG TPA: transposase, partial [Acidimicrobiales bacterium]|nr:transposase [Acidimicrobiales bacterium]
KAIVWPLLRQRCAIHRVRNVLPEVPVEHHKRIRHSKFIERTFGETRRRVKAIGRFPSERSCLGLVWAVLDRANAGTSSASSAPWRKRSGRVRG